MRAIIVASLLAMTTACGTTANKPFRIDGTDPSTYRASIGQMQMDMTEQERLTFKYALKTIEMTCMDRGKWSSTDPISPQLLSATDGLDVQQILDLAVRLRTSYSV